MTETEAAAAATTEPVIEEIPEAEANAPAEEQGEAKRSRAQKKVMKAMAKLNLRKVAGIQRVVMRNSKKGNFRIEGGEVYQVKTSLFSSMISSNHPFPKKKNIYYII